MPTCSLICARTQKHIAKTDGCAVIVTWTHIRTSPCCPAPHSTYFIYQFNKVQKCQSNCLKKRLTTLWLKSYFSFSQIKWIFFQRGESENEEQVLRSLGCCLAACLLWTSNQLGFNWVSEWKGAIRLSLFHPVSRRQACFVTQVLTDLEAFRSSDPLMKKKGCPRSLLKRLVWISRFLPQTSG